MAEVFRITGSNGLIDDVSGAKASDPFAKAFWY